jgi:WD40 repeat protein
VGPQNNAVLTVLAFSLDSAFLVLGSRDQAWVLDAASGQLLARLPIAEAEHAYMVDSASFSPDGKSLAISGGSGDVFVYAVGNWHTTATIRGGGNVTFSPEGEWLATANGNVLRLWRVGHYDAPAAEATSTSMLSSIAGV